MKRLVILLGILLFLAGLVAVVHPGFHYHQKEEVAKIGPIHATVDEEKSVEIPIGVIIALLVTGLVLVVYGSRVKQ